MSPCHDSVPPAVGCDYETIKFSAHFDVALRMNRNHSGDCLAFSSRAIAGSKYQFIPVRCHNTEGGSTHYDCGADYQYDLRLMTDLRSDPRPRRHLFLKIYFLSHIIETTPQSLAFIKSLQRSREGGHHWDQTAHTDTANHKIKQSLQLSLSAFTSTPFSD